MAAVTLGISNQGFDLPFFNYSVTDIPSGTAVLMDAANPASGDSPGGVVIPTGSGGVVGTIGVTIETIVANAAQPGRVRVNGVALCTSDGSITTGTEVQASDTGGKVGRVKTCAAATTQLGIALNTTVDGDILRVLIAVAKNA